MFIDLAKSIFRGSKEFLKNRKEKKKKKLEI